MMEGATEFRKNGFNDEDAATLAEISAMYQNVADEAISAGDAASFMISQMTAFDIGADSALHIVDAVNAVSNAFSVSSADISNNMGVMSSVMAQTGATFEESLGMLTSITEVTRSANRAARGLVSIGSRLNQVVDEGSTVGKNLTAIYNELGIELYDQEGQLRSSFDIFTDLAAIWDSLDKNTQSYIASVQAGTNQYSNFAALMQNFAHAAEATNVAINSAGSAATENERAMESLEAKVSKVQSAFQTLSASVIDSDLVKNLLDLATAFLNLLNDLPPAVTQFGLLAVALTGLYNIIPNFLKIFKQIAPMFFTVSSGATKAATGIGKLAAVLKLPTPAAIASAVAIAALIALMPKLSDWWKDLTGDYEYLQEKIDAANQSISENESRLQALNSIPPANRTEEIEEEITALEKENEALRANVDEWQNRQQPSEEQQTTIGDFEDKYTAPTKNRFKYLQDSVVYTADTFDEAVDQIVAKYKELGKELDPEIVAANLIQTQEAFEDASTGIQYYIDDAINAIAGFNSNSIPAMTDRQTAAFLDQRAALIEVRDDLQAYLDANKDAEPIYQQQLDAINLLIGQMDDYAGELVKQDNLLYEAMTGMTLTRGQASALAAVYPDLTSYIEENNGVWALNVEALYDAAAAGEESARRRVIAEKEATEAILQNVLTQIELYQTALSAFTTRTGETDYEALQTLLDYTEAAWEAKTQIALLEKEIESWNKTGISGGGGGTTTSAEDETANALEKQKQLLQDQLALLDDRAYFAEKNGATEEEIVKIYQDAQEAIHQAAEYYREQGLDDESEYLRETGKLWIEYQEKIEGIYQDIEDTAKEAWENAIQAQIESLEEQQSVYEKFFSYMGNRIDEEIDALQSQRDSVEQYWDDRIAKLQAENDEIERQIQLEQARMALAQAQSTQMLVYKDGEFQYVQDVQAISDAEAELEALEREEALRQEVANLETLKEQALASIDAQIANWEAYKEEWTSVVEHYQEEQDRLLIEQELGIELEGENWRERLDNLASYVAEYKALMAELANAQASANAGYSGGGTGKPGSAKPDYSGIKRGGSGGVYWTEPDRNQTFAGGATYDQVRDSYLNPKYFGHASGTLSAPGGLSLVGEQGPELRVLNQGDGIIPSDITKNLWDIGKLSVDQILQGKGSSYVYNFDNLTLPNVTDAMSFIRELANFKRYALQQ